MFKIIKYNVCKDKYCHAISKVELDSWIPLKNIKLSDPSFETGPSSELAISTTFFDENQNVNLQNFPTVHTLEYDKFALLIYMHNNSKITPNYQLLYVISTQKFIPRNLVLIFVTVTKISFFRPLNLTSNLVLLPGANW